MRYAISVRLGVQVPEERRHGWTHTPLNFTTTVEADEITDSDGFLFFWKDGQKVAGVSSDNLLWFREETDAGSDSP